MSCKDAGKGEINCEDNGGAERKLRTRNFDDRKCLACPIFFGRAESHYFASCLEGIALGAMMAL
jgi:hypothetical protein